MKGKLRYIAIALFVYITFLLILLPAERAYAFLENKITFPVKLYQLSGTAWKGKADLAIYGKSRLESVSWDVHFLPLLLGRMELGLDMHKNNARMQVSVGRTLSGDYYLRDVNAVMPMSEIEPIFNSMSYGLAGHVILQFDHIDISKGYVVDAAGNVHWNDAAVGQVSGISLGGFAISFEKEEEGIKGILQDDGGPLQADGILLLQPDGNYKFNGNIAARDNSSEDLKHAISLLGAPGPTGKISIMRAGKIPPRVF